MTVHEEFTREDRLFTFTISDHGRFSYDYLLGKAPDGRQVLVGPYRGDGWYDRPTGYSRWQLVWFDSQGHFLSTEDITLADDPPPLPSPFPAAVIEECRAICQHMTALGVTPGPIKVRWFWLDRNEELEEDKMFRMGIRLLRHWDPDYIWNPYSVPAADSLQDALRIVGYATNGIPFGDFLLFWGDNVIGCCEVPADHPSRNRPLTPQLQIVPDRLYTLKTYGPDDPGPYFYTGTLPDGRQGLMGWVNHQVVCLLFDATGNLTETLVRPSGATEENTPEEMGFSQWCHVLGCREASVWQAELGWRPCPIRVRFFMHPDYTIYLSDLSRAGVTAYYDPFQFYDPEEREAARQSVRSWLAEGNFVLNWMRDYHLNKDGDVIST